MPLLCGSFGDSHCCLVVARPHAFLSHVTAKHVSPAVECFLEVSRVTFNGIFRTNTILLLDVICKLRRVKKKRKLGIISDANGSRRGRARMWSDNLLLSFFSFMVKEKKKYIIIITAHVLPPCIRPDFPFSLSRVRSSPLRIRVLEPQCVFHRQPT